MNRRICILSLTTIALLTGCGAKENPDSTQEKITTIFSTPYKAECIATVKSDKTENTYSYTSESNSDGTWSLDYGDFRLSTDFENATAERGGEKITSRAAEGELVLSPSYFFKNYLSGGDIENTDDGYMLTCNIKENKFNRCTAEMEIAENFVPRRMSIKDKDGKQIINIEIVKFSR